MKKPQNPVIRGCNKATPSKWDSISTYMTLTESFTACLERDRRRNSYPVEFDRRRHAGQYGEGEYLEWYE